MLGFFLTYKIITLIILYSIPTLQEKPDYEFIYFGIALLLTIFIIKANKKYFHTSIVFKPNLSRIRKQIWIMIVPIILYGIDFVTSIPAIFQQSLLLFCASLFSALGAGIFEETRDRGFLLNGFDEAFPISTWKPLLISLCTSFLFSVTHYLNLLMPIPPSITGVNQQVFYTFFLGIVLFVVTLRTKTVFYVIIFHTMNNWTVWTPQSDLSQAGSWGSIVIIYGIIPFTYALWCLRPSKINTLTN